MYLPFVGCFYVGGHQLSKPLVVQINKGFLSIDGNDAKYTYGGSASTRR